MKQNEPQNGWQKSGESQSGVKAMGEGTAISLLSLQIQAQLSSAEELVKALSQLLPISTTSRQVLGKSIESILSSLSSLNKEADGLKPWWLSSWPARAVGKDWTGLQNKIGRAACRERG